MVCVYCRLVLHKIVKFCPSLLICSSTLSHAMLERVDTYLWSKRPTTVAPSMYQLVKNETRQAAARKPGEPATIEEQMVRTRYNFPVIVLQNVIFSLQIHTYIQQVFETPFPKDLGRLQKWKNNKHT